MLSARAIWRIARPLAALCLVFALGLPACGHHQVRNQPPFVQVSSWQLEGQQITANLHLRNVNDEALVINGLELSLRIDLVELSRYQAGLDRSVAANGLDTIGLEMTATEDGARLLRDLEAGAMPSLPYALEGRIRTAADQSLPISYQGHMYRVPGRPGQFR